MTGLDKIKNQILEEARQKADEKKLEAQKKADEILKGAKDQAGRMAEAASAQRQEEEQRHNDRVKSSCDLKRRTMLLEARQRLITQTLDRAYETLLDAPEERYFSLMEKILRQAVQKGEGKMYLSEKDLRRMPEDFEQKVMQIAQDAGGSLVIEKEPVVIDGGFILTYGGIEENCTWKALFGSNREKLSDLVYGYLWRKENG